MCGIAHSVLYPHILIITEENVPIDLPLGQSDGGDFSDDGSTSQVTLACVKVTKTNVCTPLAVPQGFCCPMSIYGCDFQVAHHGSSRRRLLHHHLLLVSAPISACFPLFSRAEVWAAQATSAHSSTGQLS